MASAAIWDHRRRLGDRIWADVAPNRFFDSHDSDRDRAFPRRSGARSARWSNGEFVNPSAAAIADAR